MTSSISSVASRSPITIAVGFLGAFVVGSLAVQLVRSQTAAMPAGVAAIGAEIAGPAALWAPLAERDITSANTAATAQTADAIQPTVEPVIGSKATLWAPFGER